MTQDEFNKQDKDYQAGVLKDFTLDIEPIMVKMIDGVPQIKPEAWISWLAQQQTLQELERELIEERERRGPRRVLRKNAKKETEISELGFIPLGFHAAE